MRPAPGYGGCLPQPDEGWSSAFAIGAPGSFVIYCEAGVRPDEERKSSSDPVYSEQMDPEMVESIRWEPEFGDRSLLWRSEIRPYNWFSSGYQPSSSTFERPSRREVSS